MKNHTFTLKNLVAALLMAAMLIVSNATPGFADQANVTNRSIHRLPAYSSHTFKIDSRSGEMARAVVIGDRHSTLVLYVYDRYGNLIDSDEDASVDCIVEWVTFRTGTFTIKVVNLGDVYNDYILLTN